MIRSKSGVLDGNCCVDGRYENATFHSDRFSDQRTSARAREGAVKSGISPRDIAEYASALGGHALEMQRQNVPLQRINL